MERRIGCTHKPAVVYVKRACDTFLKGHKESSPSYLLHNFIQNLEGRLSLDSECHEERVDQPLSVHAASSCWPSGAASCDFSVSDLHWEPPQITMAKTLESWTDVTWACEAHLLWIICNTFQNQCYELEEMHAALIGCGLQVPEMPEHTTVFVVTGKEVYHSAWRGSRFGSQS